MPIIPAVLVFAFVRAAAAAPATPAVRASTATTTEAPQGAPEMVNDGGRLPTKADFDAIYKNDLKELENDLKEQVKFINTRFTRESDLEQSQVDKKLAFRKGQRDESIAFEKSAFENWKAVMKRMREMEPGDAATERTIFDEKAAEERRKFNEDAAAKARAFMEGQNAERDRFWSEMQKLANAAQRTAREHETKVGKPDSER